MHKAVFAALGALAVTTASAAAQETAARRFQVTPVVGVMRWDDASALANKQANTNGEFSDTKITPTLGVQATYNIWRAAGIGFFFEAARPTTRGDYFPSLLLRFGTDAQLKSVSQRVTTMMYGVHGKLGFDFGRFGPYVSGGVGAMTTLADPQQNNDNRQFTNTLGQFGGGLSFGLGGASVVVDVRDYIVFDWDRNQLNIVSTGLQNTSLPSANANPPSARSTINNIRFALGLSFVPRLPGGDAESEDARQE